MITSPSNPKLKLVRRLLGSRRQREKEGLFVCEGEDLVAAAGAAGIEPVELLRAGEDVEPHLLADISTLAHAPRVIAIFRRDALPHGSREPCVALWHVADPGNVGAILRSAHAFGASVALSTGCADLTGPRAVRASMGAVFRVPTSRFEDAPRPWVALTVRGGKPVVDVEAATFVLGAERTPLPADVLARCSEQATIPMEPGAESLNVAVAGAIALYELRRRSG